MKNYIATIAIPSALIIPVVIAKNVSKGVEKVLVQVMVV